jgi:uncharacterized protein (TIGR02118 family)
MPDAADTLFIQLMSGSTPGDDAAETVAQALSKNSKVERIFVMTPARSTPSGSAYRPPAFVLEIDFHDGAALQGFFNETASREDLVSALSTITQSSLGEISYQTMSRRYAVMPSHGYWASSLRSCTYLVEYPGQAADLEAWLNYFDRAHALILARLPGVRMVTAFRPAVADISVPAWRPAKGMQKNKIVFDDLRALDTALASPVIADIRADAAKFSDYSPAPTRVALHTRTFS